MKRVLLILLVLPLVSIGQSESDLSWLNNDSISFTVRTYSPKPELIGKVMTRNLIAVDVDSIKLLRISKLNNDQIKEYFENNNTDWAINILLYAIYKKDAMFFIGLEISDWRSSFSNNDKRYWIKFVKKLD